MNEGMENLKQIEDLENLVSKFDLKVMSAIEELRKILKVYHYESVGTKYLDKSCVISLENLLGSLLKGGK
tara:strand:- start:185 stop:394 length:210 start_codon:yes stop_codon:yes gene_type:complete